MHRVARTAVLVIALGGLTLTAQQPAHAPVTERDLLAGLKNPSRWLTFSGDYTGQRHSPLTQLTPENVAGLVPQWIFQTDIPGLPGRGIENSPIVVDGILYVTGNNNQAWAVDAPRRSSAVELPSRAAGEFRRVGVLRTGEPRLRDSGRPAVHGHARRAPGVARPKDGRGDLGCGRRGCQERQRDHGGAAGREEQGDHRRGGRRPCEPWIRRRLRRANRRARVALLHDSGSGRARQRVVAERRRGRARRRRGVGDRQLRSGAESRVLRHRQSESGLLRRRSAGRQSLHLFARSRSTPTPACCGGTFSSRRTTSTTGTRRTCRCRRTSRSAAGHAKW